MGAALSPWSLELRLHSEHVHIGELRRWIVSALRMERSGTVDVDAAEAILGELLANVFTYSPGPFSVRLVRGADGACTLEVSDAGAPFRYPPPAKDLAEPGGHGLRLATALSRSLQVTHRAGKGNCVVAVFAEPA